MKKLFTMILAAALLLTLAACGAQKQAGTYTVGICNYVDDASLNQIVENLRAQLKTLEREKGVTFEVKYENCNADSNLMQQIIGELIAQDVDLLVGIATPVAMAMQAATEDTDIPVIFAAVSDPVSAGLVSSLEKPGANITGTSDYLNTNALMELLLAQEPQVKTVGLLYDMGQDSSTTPIRQAKAYLEGKGIAFVERTGTNTEEIMLAAQALIADGVDAVFTPTDNTVMVAELSIYQALAEAGIPHYTGADSFALNGAFLGFGVDYANLGRETANMVSAVLTEGNDPGHMPVKTFDNGTATVNTETCAALGLDFEAVKLLLAPYCTQVIGIETAEEFQ